MLRRIDVLLAIVLVGAAVNLVLGPRWSTLVSATPGVRMGFTRIHGFFKHPSLLGEFAVMGFVLWVIRYARLRDARIALWLPVLLVALAASLMVKPIISLALVLLAAYVADSRLRISVAGIALVLGGLALVLWQPLWELATHRFGTYAAHPLGKVRSLSYIYAWEIMVLRPLLGMGPGMFGGHIAHLLGTPVYEALGFTEMLTTHLTTTDTYWPHLFGEVGLLGGGLFVGFLAAAGHQALRSGTGSRNEAAAVLGLVSALWTLQLCSSAFAAQLFEGTAAWFLPVWVLGYSAAWTDEIATPTPVARPPGVPPESAGAASGSSGPVGHR
jgi:signal transduction histidine kinase